MKRVKTFVLCTLVSFSIHAQSSLEIKSIVHNTSLKTNKQYSSENHNFKIDNLKFYISNIVYLNQGDTVLEFQKKHHLIDIADTNSLKLLSALETSFDEVRFQIGIDSSTNVSGALDGDLDPTKGMYWTWQSGYINFKLEGTSSYSQQRNGAFEYHLGGYLPPFQTIQSVSLKTKSTNQVKIELDIGKFLELTNIETTPKVMSPSPEAKRLSEVLSTCFNINE